MSFRVLLVEDDARLAGMVADYLGEAGFHAAIAATGAEAERRLKAEDFDAVILDLMLPDTDGLDLCKRIRAQSAIPLLMLTARGDPLDRVIGLEQGADDYLPKPFEPRELLARLHTVLRRLGAAAANGGLAAKGRLVFENLSIDLDRREVRAGERAIDLTGTEFELLALLAGSPGRVFSRDDILTRLRGHGAEEIASRAVDILVSRLRRKLEPLDCIRTLRNAGYVFAGVRA